MSSTSTSFPCMLESARSQGAFQARFTGLRARGPGAVRALPAPMPPSTPLWAADVSGPHFGSHCKTPVMPEELGEGELVPGWIYHPFIPISKPSLGLAEAWQ